MESRRANLGRSHGTTSGRPRAGRFPQKRAGGVGILDMVMVASRLALTYPNVYPPPGLFTGLHRCPMLIPHRLRVIESDCH